MKLKFVVLLAFVASALSLIAKSNSKFPETYAFNRGVECFQENDYEGALEWFNKELNDNPDDGYAYVYISILRLMNDENGLALSAINQALKKLPKKDKTFKSLAYQHRGNIYFAMEDTITGLGDYEMAIKINPENKSNYENRAEVYSMMKRYDLSDADYQKIIDLDQGDVTGYMGIGINANEQKNWDNAIAQFNKVIKLAPDNSSAYTSRAEAYIGKEKWAEATEDLVKALDIDGDYQAFYTMQHLPAEATDLLKSKLKVQMTKQPTNRYWPYCLATVAEANEQYSEAISLYEKANKLDPSSILLENISKCYLDQRNYPKALDYAERAIAMNPVDYDLISLKADIFSRMGRFDDCLTERDRYVENNSEEPFAYLARANDLMNAKRFSDAIEDYNTAIELAPVLDELPPLLIKRGDAYRFNGKLDEAVKDYELIIKVEKDSVLSSNSWTPFAYSGLGNAEKAIESMQYILDNDTTDVVKTLYNAACLYARVEKPNEAIQFLKEAIEKGYKEFSHIEADYDFDSIRELPEYREILHSIGTEPATDSEVQDDATDYRTEIVEIPFTKEGGVTKVKCDINGIPLHFVFDTGASDVTISMVEANFMLKNDYIKPSDIIGSARYVDANGDISEGTVVNLRKVNFGGLELNNVRASVVRNQKAPLLLGQSVLGRLGKIEIDNHGSKLVITHKVSK